MYNRSRISPLQLGVYKQLVLLFLFLFISLNYQHTLVFKTKFVGRNCLRIHLEFAKIFRRKQEDTQNKVSIVPVGEYMFVNVTTTRISYVCISPGGGQGDLRLTEKFACLLLADDPYVPA